jgi:hypothetical protein
LPDCHGSTRCLILPFELFSHSLLLFFFDSFQLCWRRGFAFIAV